jgi:hypothetical protein
VDAEDDEAALALALPLAPAEPLEDEQPAIAAAVASTMGITVSNDVFRARVLSAFAMRTSGLMLMRK